MTIRMNFNAPGTPAKVRTALQHYDAKPQERTQIDGRWHGARAPLCGTGDGHYLGVHPSDWSSATGAAQLVKVDCPQCCGRKHLIAPRKRQKVLWADPT